MQILVNGLFDIALQVYTSADLPYWKVWLLHMLDVDIEENIHAEKASVHTHGVDIVFQLCCCDTDSCAYDDCFSSDCMHTCGTEACLHPWDLIKRLP